MSEKQKKDIIEKIKSLQNEQDELISQLEKLEIGNNNTNDETNDTNRDELRVGDSVIILNPGRFTERTGVICQIGKRVTVETKKGRKVVRAKKNVRKVES
jgi:hypothetical protein